MSLRRAMRQWSRALRSRLTHLNSNKMPVIALKNVTKDNLSYFYMRHFPNFESESQVLRERLSQLIRSLSSDHGKTIDVDWAGVNVGHHSSTDLKRDSLQRFCEDHKKMGVGQDAEPVTNMDSRHILNELKWRRMRLREDLVVKKYLLQQVLSTRQQEVKSHLIKRRELVRQALQLRKEGIDKKERQLRERGRYILEDLRNTKDLMKEKFDEAVERENIYTIPNLLCITRIAFSPLLGYLIVTGSFHHALAFMTIAGFSDWLDGWIARNYPSQSSKFGSFLDPMADKVLIGTLFLSLTYVNLIPVWLTCLIVGRDVALVAAGFVIRYKSLPPPRTLTRYFDATNVTAQLAPTLISKVNTGVQLAFVASTLTAPVFDYVGHPALDALCYITAASTVVAAVSYIISKDTFRYIGRKK